MKNQFDVLHNQVENDQEDPNPNSNKGDFGEDTVIMDQEDEEINERGEAPNPENNLDLQYMDPPPTETQNVHDLGGCWWPPAYSTWTPTTVSLSFSVSLIVAQLSIFGSFFGLEILKLF